MSSDSEFKPIGFIVKKPDYCEIILTDGVVAKVQLKVEQVLRKFEPNGKPHYRLSYHHYVIFEDPKGIYKFKQNKGKD